MDLVYLRGVCNKLSFLNADTDRNRKGFPVYLLVNLLRMRYEWLRMPDSVSISAAVVARLALVCDF